MSQLSLARHIKPNNKVDLWDFGPQRAGEPVEPQKPDEKLKGAEKAAAEVEYEDALDLYKDQLRAWSASRKANKAWHEEKGGPVKVELWAIDARHAMEVEPLRYRLDLPKSVKPGRAQLEAEENARAEAEALERARSTDPQFGNKQLEQAS
jgi:hypothetical protein